MNQIEKPLSILLIVAAIGYTFVFGNASNGYTTIENNTSSGYILEAAELSTGYNVKAPSTSNYKAVEVQVEDCDITEVDSLVQTIIDSVFVNAENIENDIEVELEVTTTEEE
tara:strand:+ start:265 stop:600 length:336 start_codon:yes stop_codon:yes gene_type:complete